MRLFLVAIACLQPLAAASLAPYKPEIPVAFEENRGQSRSDFRYIAGYYNFGFSCAGQARSHAGPLPLRDPALVRFAASNLGCRMRPLDPDGSFAHYYRGGARIENVARFRKLRLEGVWPGVDVEYQAGVASFTATFSLSSAAALRFIRMDFAQAASYPGISTSGSNVYSAWGRWKLRAPQAGTTVTPVANGATLTFEAPGTDRGAPLTFAIEMAVETVREPTPVVAAAAT